MKILITGYSGSGKSTLCRKLQERYELPSLHLDAVQFLPAWKTRAKTVLHASSRPSSTSILMAIQSRRL